ncbi:hypothetical protein LDENG_00067570 [Lucifuga dentata]|nr:hypothetical protein LDENG_00067570 [Lucifuga dentata]
MMEKEQVVIAAAELFEGDELPEVTDQEIDLLMNEQDHFRRAEGLQTEERKRIREHEGALSSIDQLKETLLGTEQDSVWLLDEEPGQPVKVPLAAATLEMTPPQVSMPSPPAGSCDKAMESSCGEVVVPPHKKRSSRRRQLVFADPQVQISEQMMKRQTGNVQAETTTLSDMLLDFPTLTKRPTPAQLFSAPCGSLLHTDLQSLWKQCILLQYEKHRGEKEDEEEEAREESVQDREELRTERARIRSGMREATVSDVILDMSKEDKSQSDLITPASRWSPQEESRLQMEPIMEENIEMPQAQNEAGSRDVQSWISFNLQRFEAVTFSSLLPPEADRGTAAHTLYKLLGEEIKISCYL